MNSAVRRQLPIADDLSKLFDLDRCFSVMEYKVSTDKTLVIVNIHMSAYDEGGVIRNAQLDILNSFLESVNDENHYVIIGGDFNHDLVTFNPKYGFNNENIAFVLALIINGFIILEVPSSLNMYASQSGVWNALYSLNAIFSLLKPYLGLNVTKSWLKSPPIIT